MKPYVANEARARIALHYERQDTIANPDDVAREISVLKDRLSSLNQERSEIANRLSVLEHAQIGEATRHPTQLSARVTAASSTAEKIALFRSLFRKRCSATLGVSALQDGWSGCQFHGINSSMRF